MKEISVCWETLPEAYHRALEMLDSIGEFTPCPDWDTSQKEVSMTMHILNPLQEPMISKLFMGGFYELEQYRQEMLDGILDFEIEKGNWKYTYHDRYKDQYTFVIEELKRNPESRRAVMDIRTKEDMYSEDPACWQHAQYFIREGKLHCKVLFRSNDACKATFMNAFALIMLQKRIADELGVEVGTYTHRANSFHCYEKDFPLLEGYIERIKRAETKNNPNILTYNYKGEWEDLMEDCKPEIEKMVKRLKGEKDG